ncbi:thiamine phosphate synthase [Sphingomonas sp. MMS24-J13]|uniref:thiamine phosphate synthase n=1 Tax=Sphingomonas sp. MMS24-J13 TaxID=3238686 RepID=UPI0038500E8B
MAFRHPLPRLWLMTDERIGDSLWPALASLPRGAGVIFRHYATPAPERRRLFEAVRAITRRRRLMLILAGSPRDAIAWRADGAHGRSRHVARSSRLVRTAPAHDTGELIAAIRAGVDLIFLSPVFLTRSHPGQRALGPVRFGLAAAPSTTPIIALGGMTPRGFQQLERLGAYGWAAIDALTLPSSVTPAGGAKPKPGS